MLAVAFVLMPLHLSRFLFLPDYSIYLLLKWLGVFKGLFPHPVRKNEPGRLSYVPFDDLSAPIESGYGSGGSGNQKIGTVTVNGQVDTNLGYLLEQLLWGCDFPQQAPGSHDSLSEPPLLWLALTAESGAIFLKFLHYLNDFYSLVGITYRCNLY